MNRASRRFRAALEDQNLDAAEKQWATGEVDLEAREEGMTALHAAVAVEEVDYLLDKGADPEARFEEDFGEQGFGDRHRATPLMLAAEDPDDGMPVMQRLLDAGANPNAQDHAGQTALFYALDCGDAKRVELLFDAGADVDLKTHGGQSPLMRAHLVAPSLVGLLRGTGASQAGMDNQRLMAAAEKGDLSEVRRLLDAGADPDYRDERTPLIDAAAGGHREVVHLLLAAGADPNLAESDSPAGDFTALCRAAGGGHLEAVKLLLKAGADPTAGPLGIRPLDYAKEGERFDRKDEVSTWKDIRALLRQAMATAAERGDKGAATVVPGAEGDLSPASAALLEALPLPSDLGFYEFKDFGTVLLESSSLPVAEVAEAWRACRDAARGLGWSCFVVTHSLSGIEAARSVLEESVAKLESDSAQAFFARSEPEFGDDEDLEDEEDEEEAYSLAIRRQVLARLTRRDLPEFRDGTPDFSKSGWKTGKRRRLVLLRGGPELGPVFYHFGGFNACPMPHEHALVVRDWHSRYGIEIAFIGYDTFELYLAEPLEDLDEIKAAAAQQLLYCDESMSVREDLARVMSRVWGYWWD